MLEELHWIEFRTSIYTSVVKLFESNAHATDQRKRTRKLFAYRSRPTIIETGKRFTGVISVEVDTITGLQCVRNTAFE